MSKTKKVRSFFRKKGKIAKSVLTIALVVAAVGVTYALFSDRAESQANSLSTGSIDLKIRVPATDCNDWSETCPGKQWSQVYPGWSDQYEVYLKNASDFPYELKITPLVEETGSSQALYDNTYLEITWENGAKTTGRYNLEAWKTNTNELERMAQNAEAGPYLMKLDIPKEVGNEIAGSSIEFNLVFGTEQPEVRTLTLINDPSEAGTVTGDGLYADGQLVAISATAGTGWEFFRWDGTGVTDQYSASTTVLMDGDKTVTAVFAKADLLAEWTFNENTGSTVADSSNRGNDGTITNATWVAGREGSALEFTGTGYVSIPYSSKFDLGNTGPFTIEYWFNRHTQVWSAAFSQASTTNQYGSYAKYASRFWNGSDEHMWTLARAVPDAYMITETMQRGNYPSLNAWHHVVNVYDGTSMKTYIDGVQTGYTVDVSGLAIAPAANYPSLIGAMQNVTSISSYFDGLIDHMRIWKKALSTAEILDHYNNP